MPEGQRALSHAVASPPLVNVSSVISIVCALVTRLRPGHRARYPDRDPLLRTLLTVLTVVSSDVKGAERGVRASDGDGSKAQKGGSPAAGPARS